jgi:alkylhydroperoxidase family enzyme
MREALAASLPANPTHPFPPRDPSRPKGLNALGFLAHHPTLTEAYNHLVGHLLYTTTLTARQRELLILRVAHLRDAPYEWAQHVLLARDAQISTEEIDRARAGPDAPGWGAQERVLLRAADELLSEARIGDATYAALASELDTEQMMDLVWTVGSYELLAMAFRTFDVQLDEDLAKYA